jgi:hypothetical protein
LLSVARTHDDRRLPETRGERIVAACCLAIPFAGIVAIIVASVVATIAGAAAFFVAFLSLVVYIVRFLSTPAVSGTSDVFDHEQQCRVCGAPFRPIRMNQIYCGRVCRDEAAARRRKSRRMAAASRRPQRRARAGGSRGVEGPAPFS